MDKTISIIVPVFNEENNIQPLYNELSKILIDTRYELIFVNDGSTDNSVVEICRLLENNNRIKLIDFSRNFGHEAATSAGVDYANGDAAIILDADLQDPPSLIPKMVKLWQEGYDVVYGVRESRDSETFLKKMTSKLFYRCVRLLVDIKIPVDTGDFRLIDRKVINDFKRLPEKNRFFRGLISWIGYKQIGIKFKREKRHSGKTKYNYFRLVRLAFDSITSFSTKPLTFITFIGFLMWFFSLIMVFFFIIMKILYNYSVPGWTSLVVIVLSFSGFQILLMGIMCEYLARMFIEVKNRPLYLINRIIDKNSQKQHN